MKIDAYIALIQKSTSSRLLAPSLNKSLNGRAYAFSIRERADQTHTREDHLA